MMAENAKHVAIIGAGIVGVSTAIWARRAGHDVTLIDRLGPGEGTSYGNAGLLASAALVPVTVPGLLSKAPRMALDPKSSLFVKWSYLPRLAPWLWRYLRHANASSAQARAAALLPLIGDSLADHQALADGMDAAHWIVPCDYVSAYPTRADFDGDAFGWDIRRNAGFDYTVLEGAALRDYDPSLGAALDCAVVVPGHGRIRDPGRYVQDLARHAQGMGVRLLKADVSALVREGRRLTGLRLHAKETGGEVFNCDCAVVTAGVWSGPLAQQMGLKVPLAPESGFHLELIDPSVMPRSPVMITQGKFVMTPMEGRLRLAGMVGYVGLDGAMPEAPFDLFESHVRRVLPGISWRDTRRWMGHRPAIVDSCPMIGAVPDLEGAYVGFGHDHVGLTAGPRTGRLLSQLISGARPNMDLQPFAPDRFT